MPFLAEIGRAAESFGMEMKRTMVQPGQPLDAAFETLADMRPGALIVQEVSPARRSSISP